MDGTWSFTLIIKNQAENIVLSKEANVSIVSVFLGQDIPSFVCNLDMHGKLIVIEAIP